MDTEVQTWNVARLIQELQKFPPDAEVITDSDGLGMPMDEVTWYNEAKNQVVIW